jgi:hypothetical protein
MLAIAARISGVATPPALQPDATGLYTITGEGLTPNKTQLLLGDVALWRVAAPDPAAGFCFVDAAGMTLTFRRPALGSGRYFVRIRVNGVECPPSWWVDVP